MVWLPDAEKNIALSCTVFSYLTLNNIVSRDLKIWVRGHSRLFKLVPFESLDAVSYSPYSNYGRIFNRL